MKIIAVNISKSLQSGATPLHAAQRAWKLNLTKCNKFCYVVGVANNFIQRGAYFKIVSVSPSGIPARVAFKLIPCTRSRKIKIDNYTRNMKLSRFVTKYIV